MSHTMPHTPTSLPDLIDPAQTTEEAFLRQIFVRDQMAEWSKQPLVMARADGVFYWDVEGKRYLDAISGIYVVSVGHNNRRVIEAIRQQLDSLAFSPPMHGTNPQAVQLANLLAELAPGDLSTVKFECGGAEVIEAAIKLARQYHKLTGSPGKYKIISRYQSWHGSTLAALSASGLKSRKTVNEPMAPGFLHVFPPTCYRCPFGKTYPDCGITCATIVGDVVEMEDPATVAAILVEPIGHTGGVIDPPEEYLPILREICDRHNILLIFDEIITGIGRTGRMFAAETFGVTPDVLCVAKGLSGGYAPLSAMICRRGDRRRLLGPDRREPRLRGRAYVRGQPDLVRGRHRRASRDHRARPAGKRPSPGRATAGGLRGHGPKVLGDRRRARQGLVPGDRVRARPRDQGPLSGRAGPGRQGGPAGARARTCFAGSTLTGSRSALRWSSTAEQIDEMVAILDRSLGEVLSEVESSLRRREPSDMRRRRLAPHVRAPVRYLIYLRFARYLLWEFRWSLGVFTVLVLGGGWILHRFYDHGVPELSPGRATRCSC